MGQLRGRQRGPSRGDASPHFPGDAIGKKALSWCAFLGFWGYGLEEGAFSVRRRPGSGLSPLRARAGAALVFFWADAQQGKSRGFLERKPPKELLRSLRSASLQLQLLPGAFPRFRQGAQRNRPPPIHSPRNPWKRTEKAPSPQRRPREKRQGGNPRIAPFPRGFLREARARRWRNLPGLYLPSQVWYNSRRKWGRGRREKTSRPARRREAACATCSPQVWYNQRNLRERRRLRAHFGY